MLLTNQLSPWLHFLVFTYLKILHSTDPIHMAPPWPSQLPGIALPLLPLHGTQHIFVEWKEVWIVMQHRFGLDKAWEGHAGWRGHGGEHERKATGRQQRHQHKERRSWVGLSWDVLVLRNIPRNPGCNVRNPAPNSTSQHLLKTINFPTSDWKKNKNRSLQFQTWASP